MKIKKYHKLIFILIFIIILIMIFIVYYGKRYLSRFNKFIYENNKLIIREEINSFIFNNKINNLKELYKLNYNNNGEIINANLNINYINSYLSLYIDEFNKSLNNTLYHKYINDYFKYIKTKNNTYILVPLGIIYNNPFLFNIGPKVILSYDFINSITFNVDLVINNYGLNNVLVSVYLNLDVEQSTLRPVLDKVNKYSYKFLLSSNIVYGRVSDYLGTTITSKSDNIKIK